MESTDCLNKDLIPITNSYIQFFQDRLPNALCSFATKLPQAGHQLIDVKDRKARIRISLMPQKISSIVEPATNLILDRIKSINMLYEKGYEIHINLSPIIYYTDWLIDYKELLELIIDNVTAEVLNQIKYEVIFLTYHPQSVIHNNLWCPEVNQLLWLPSIQEQKKKDGTVRYKAKLKRLFINQISSLIKEITPQCSIRYIF